jgi:hypothetical protein
MVERTGLNSTLYVHCLSSYNLISSHLLKGTCNFFVTINRKHASISTRPSRRASVRPCHEGETRCSYTQFIISALDTQESSDSRTTCFAPRQWAVHELRPRTDTDVLEKRTMICSCQIWGYNSSGPLPYGIVTVPPDLSRPLIVI